MAATGTVSATGDVGPVAGVEQKTASVEAAGADIFLVPQGAAGEANGDGLDVRSVSRLEEAILSLLRTAA